MTKQIEYFGGRTRGRLILDHEPPEEIRFDRELWFDRDIDGRWLVGVTNHHAGEETTGAIVVKDATVSAFIEVFATLIAEPGQFAGEDVTIGPAWDGRLPDR